MSIRRKNPDELRNELGITGGGSGDVVGPASATSGAVVLYDGTTGKLIKNSTILPTTVGIALNNLTNPSAITFIRINADNTVTARTASEMLTDLGVSSTLKATKTVTSAELLTSFSAPVTIIAAPGANKYINIISICCSYNYGTTVYDFSSALFFYFTFYTGFNIPQATINDSADVNLKLNNLTLNSPQSSTNVALVLKSTSADPTTGNGDLDVVVYYTIEDTNT